MKRAQRIIVGISGASGALYARRVLQLLYAGGVEIHLVVSAAGRRLLHEELGASEREPGKLLGLDNDQWEEQETETGSLIVHNEQMHPGGVEMVVHNNRDIGAAIASGSFEHEGMIIVPCSSNSLAAVAAGVSNNLLQRAAAVTLKERRKLILCHRETPLSLIDARNMVTLTEAGAIVAPANPGFYLMPTSVDDLVDFMAGRLLDLLGIGHDLDVRWDRYLRAVKETNEKTEPEQAERNRS